MVASILRDRIGIGQGYYSTIGFNNLLIKANNTGIGTWDVSMARVEAVEAADGTVDKEEDTVEDTITEVATTRQQK